MALWVADQFRFPALSPRHRIARTPDELQFMVNCLTSAPDRAWDFETNGLRYANKGKHPIGYGLGYMASDGQPYCWYVPVAHETMDEMAPYDAAKRAFEDALKGAESFIGHNLKYDLNVARAAGWEVPERVLIHDTLVQAYLIFERRPFKLEHLAKTTPGCTQWDIDEMIQIHDGFTRDRAKVRKMTWKRDKANIYRESYLSRYGHAEVPVALESEYCCRDVAHSLLLDQAQRAQAQGHTPQRAYLYANEMLLVRALADMEFEGQEVDADALIRYADELDVDLELREDELAREFGATIDWANNNQLRDLLFDHLKITPLKQTRQGLAAVDRESLLLIRDQHPGISLLSEYSLRVKVRQAFTHGLVFHQCDDGKIHCSFKQAGTSTGRLSAGDPNLQQIPSRNPELADPIRRAFIIQPGRARIYADYSQIELRMLAWITGAKVFREAYRSPVYDSLCEGKISYEDYIRYRKREPEVDVHGDVAENVLHAVRGSSDWKPKRSAAKIINFGVSYGMSHFGLMRNPDLHLSEDEAKDYFNTFHSRTPEIAKCKIDLFSKMLRRAGRGGVPQFTNWAGRTCHAPNLLSWDEGERASAQRSAFASLVQGSAGELTRFSIVALWKAKLCGKLPATATSTVHDEIQLDCDVQDVPYVAFEGRRAMEDTFRGLFGTTPIVADIEVTTTNWAEKESYE